MAAPRTASHAHHVKEGAAFVYDKLSRRQMTPYEITELHDADLVNHVDEATGKSPLHLVAKRDQRKHALALIEAGADPHVTDNSGGTPLHEAATWGSEAVAKALVFGGAVLDAVNEDGMTPVDLALSFNEDTVAKAIEQFAEEKRLEDEERRRMVTAEGAALMNAVKASTDVEAVRARPSPDFFLRPPAAGRSYHNCLPTHTYPPLPPPSLPIRASQACPNTP